MFTQETDLCSVLGFEDDFAQSLGNITQEMRNNQTDLYFLLSFMEERDET